MKGCVTQAEKLKKEKNKRKAQNFTIHKQHEISYKIMLSIMGKLIGEFNNIGDFVNPTNPNKKSPASSPSSLYTLSSFRGALVGCHLLNTDDYDESVINLDKNEVNYRAEGNANIVLALPKMRKVLRIRKSLIVNSSQTGKLLLKLKSTNNF